MAKSNYKQIMKMLRIKKLQSAIKKIQKKFFFLIKPKNLYKVLFLLAILGLLYFIREKFLVKEGMMCEAEEFEDKINGKKALVLFHAPWCGYCKKFMPEWDTISSEAESKLDESTTIILKVDCGDSQNNSTHAEIMEKYGIKGYPTIISFDKTGNHVEYEGDRSKSGIFGFLGINDSNSEGFIEGMENSCEDSFTIPLTADVSAGSNVLVFAPDQSFNFTALGGERPIHADIVKGNTIQSVGSTAETDGYRVTLETALLDHGSIDAYQGNKHHVITDNNTDEVSGNELCKGFIHAEWEKEPEGGKDYFFVKEKDASVISPGMYLAEGYGVEMPPHVYRSYVTEDGLELRVVIAGGTSNEDAINETATLTPQVINGTIISGTNITFIKPSKSWTSNPYGEGIANNNGTAVTG